MLAGARKSFGHRCIHMVDSQVFSGSFLEAEKKGGSRPRCRDQRSLRGGCDDRCVMVVLIYRGFPRLARIGSGKESKGGQASRGKV